MTGESHSGPFPGANRLELFLFCTDATTVREAVGAGVRGIVVDWERQGKKERQAGADTRGRALDAAVAEIRAGLDLCATRSSDEVARDHGNLMQAVQNLMGGGRA